MSDIVLHPLTALHGVPAYTADDYRRVVNPFLFPSDGSAFGGVQGVRYGSPSPLSTIDGLTVTVKPHCGTVRPWGETGSYTYTIAEPMAVNVPDSIGDYKIVVTVYDPSLSHGKTPGALLQAWEASTPDAAINGLVIARVTAGVVSDVAPVLRQSMLVEVADRTMLRSLPVADGQEALETSTGLRWVKEGGVWHDTPEVVTTNWLNGSLTILYGADSCTVQVSGVQIDDGPWASVDFPTKVKPACCPAVEVSAALCVENGASSTGLVIVGIDGTISITNRGGSGSTGSRRGSVSWPISRRY